MADLSKIKIGIRDSKLSRAQTDIFIEASNRIENFNKTKVFEVKMIKTSGDIYKDHRLDLLGGKGLFIKEIEDQIISGELDLGVHSLKDLPATEMSKKLEIICWLKRYTADDVFISNSNKSFFDLPAGSIVGTSSIRRRAQILNLRKDLRIKLLRGNVDTRIKKLRDNEYDAIILSRAGLQRLKMENEISEVLEHEYFLPAACQGAVGIQARCQTNLKEFFSPINHKDTEIECQSEREVLRIINANCNSPISVHAKINDNQIVIASELFDHDGKKLFSNTIKGKIDQSLTLCHSMGQEILSTVGAIKINQLDKLKDDFNYTP